MLFSINENSCEHKPSGFASPAQGYEEQYIDLNRLLIKNPHSTYFFKLNSSDMEGMGLPMGALLVVDRSKTPDFFSKEAIVVIRRDNEFLCRLMTKRSGKIIFTNGKSDIIPMFNPFNKNSIDNSIDQTEIIGVVTASIKLYAL
ncbi:MAG: hypothetical protein FWB86_07625 [Treponema sp.]|nr:hypothetical protein [Treponema sp.]MCL2251885.1 hypothetical protein [Treponema sp.]